MERVHLKASLRATNNLHTLQPLCQIIALYSYKVNLHRQPVVGSKLWPRLLFMVVSEYVSPLTRVNSRTQESQRGRNGVSWLGPIDALRPAADDPNTQEHPKSRGLQQSVQEKERDLVGDRLVLIL
jgi:hypothetical protein